MLKRVLRYWLFHLLIIWLLLNLYHSLSYLYQLRIWGTLTVNADNTPLTIWQILITHNLQRPDYVFLIPFVFLVEINYWYIFKIYNLFVFAACSIIIGLFSTTVLLFFNTAGFTNKYSSNFLSQLWLLLVIP